MQVKCILGIDVSKRKLDVCLMVNDKAKHKMFNNDSEGYTKLLDWCHQKGADNIHVCLEATSWYSEGVAEFMYDNGCIVSVVNPSQIKAFAKSQLLRQKTDKTDAAMIAMFCKSNNPSPWSPIPLEVKHLRDMYRTLASLKEHKQQLTNQLEQENIAISSKKALQGFLKAAIIHITELEKDIEKHINNHSNLKEAIDGLTDIKGIGTLTAGNIIAEMPPVENCNNARQYAAFAGLSPSYNQSGSSLNKPQKICKIGSSRIRKALYMPALVVKNHNEHFKEFCLRLEKKGKKPKVIIVALMRKLMHIFFGILKNKQPFNCNLV